MQFLAAHVINTIGVQKANLRLDTLIYKKNQQIITISFNPKLGNQVGTEDG